MLVNGLLGTFGVCWATPTIRREGPWEPLMPLGAMEGKTPLWSIPIAATVHPCPPAASPDRQRPPCRLLALPPLDSALPHPDIHPILPRSPSQTPGGGAAGVQQAAQPWARSPGLEPTARQPQPLRPDLCPHPDWAPR